METQEQGLQAVTDEQLNIEPEAKLGEFPGGEASPPVVASLPEPDAGAGGDGKGVAGVSDSAPAIPFDLAMRAAQAGLSEEDIRGVAPEALPKLISAVERMGLRHVAAAARAGGDPPASKKEEAADALVDLDDAWDADIRGRLNPVFAEVRKLRQGLQDVEAIKQQHAAMRELFSQRLTDDLFAELPEDYAGLLGAGPLRKLGKESAQYGNRVKVLERMSGLAQAAPDKDPSELLVLALGLTFPEEVKKLTSESASRASAAHRQTRGVARPSKQAPPGLESLPLGEERAVGVVSRMWKKITGG